MDLIRDAAVAGTFYPKNSTELRSTVKNILRNTTVSKKLTPKAIIAPHAGYVYSGAVAGSAYAYLEPIANNIRRVLLLGPCHRVALNGLAATSMDYFETPLGKIPIDKEAREAIIDFPQVKIFDNAHELEHSLEVHLPFLQVILDTFFLLPIVVGQAQPQEVAAVLDKLWGGAETFIVVSSDLSHYLDYKSAQKIDYQTCRAIESMSPEDIKTHGACGRYPVGGLLNTAKARGLNVKTVDLRNSGDTAGPKKRVVGYGAWVFSENPSIVNQNVKENNKIIKRNEDTQKQVPAKKTREFETETRYLIEKFGTTLLQLAAKSIKIGLAKGKRANLDLQSFPPLLQEKGASFVTLTKAGKLRGCIGSLKMHQPIASDIIDNAYKAAFLDPRFPKVTGSELKSIDISISLLSTHIPVTIKSEQDLLQQLRPGIDGLIIQDGHSQALFLPSVWKQLPEPKQFLHHLKTKAGMAPNHWSSKFNAWRFITEEVSSSSLKKEIT